MFKHDPRPIQRCAAVAAGSSASWTSGCASSTPSIRRVEAKPAAQTFESSVIISSGPMVVSR